MHAPSDSLGTRWSAASIMPAGPRSAVTRTYVSPLAHLVDERERAGLALEDVTRVAAQDATRPRPRSRRAAAAPARASTSRRRYARRSLSASSERRTCSVGGVGMVRRRARRRALAPSGSAPLPRGCGRTRRSDRAPAARRACRRAPTRTSARRARAPSGRRAAGRRAAGARRPGARRHAPRRPGRTSSPTYQAVAVDSRPSRSASQAWRTETWVTTSRLRPRARTTSSSANGSTLPPIRLRCGGHPWRSRGPCRPRA